MQNFNLLRELGQVRKPVLLKRGIAATIEELLLSSEYILSGGNYDVILCERGIRTYETATRNTMDISAIPVREEALAPAHRRRSLARHGPPRHGCPPWPRPRWLRAPMRSSSRVHPNADKAASDAAQTLYLDQFEKLMGELRVMAEAVGRTL